MGYLPLWKVGIQLYLITPQDKKIFRSPVRIFDLRTDDIHDDITHLIHPFGVEPRAQGEQEGGGWSNAQRKQKRDFEFADFRSFRENSGGTSNIKPYFIKVKILTQKGNAKGNYLIS